MFSVNVNGIAKGLESIEADPDGQNDIESSRCDRASQEREGLNEVIEKKIIIFKEAQETEVDDDGRPYKEFTLMVFLVFSESDTHEEIDEGAEENERQEAPVPPAVEHIARHENQRILCFEALLENEPIEHKDNGEE